MMSLKKKRRIQLIIIFSISLTFSAFLIGYAMRDGIQYFRSPSQVIEQSPLPTELFRIGGLVKDESWIKGKKHQFVVTDTENDIPVEFIGILPDLFREGQGVIATGNLVNNIFIASEVLAKHDENYIPKEVMDTLKNKGLYKPIK
ncbi:MAG: cytochrome c maturation protein CcmE [Rhodobacteraceae bacterium]|jgi:cytochrome c-type biogenesis protein CcmE|nr:cytochrome c maturation protein CcmE [Paracoccaceae bacterium]|tara:strand:- start:192 stop:626 length:435 start_codon:yes stop_codon:yes gene_type:complete